MAKVGAAPHAHVGTDVIDGWMYEHAKTLAGCAIMVANGATYTPPGDMAFAEYTYRNRVLPVLEASWRWGGKENLYAPKTTKAKKLVSPAEAMAMYTNDPPPPVGTGWDDIFTDEDYT